MASNKKFGLIVPEKAKPLVFQASRNVFGNDSESDEEANKKPVLLRPSENTNRQAKIAQSKAIVEDPTVYQYDEVYDTMKNEKELKKDKSKEIKKPRYIENLIKSANKRKIENERRIERQIQKERETEGDEFADKEVFVTSAYKKKLEEMSLEEEKEKREEYLESIGDVTKQRDLGGFYRHLYEQKLGSDNTIDSQNKPNTKLETENQINKGKIPKDSSKQETSESSKKRNYRKRKSSSENNTQLSEGEVVDSEEEINRLNLDDIRLAKKHKQSKENIDADSDFSIDESSDEDNDTKNHITKEPSEVVFKKPEDKEIIEKKEKNNTEENEKEEQSKSNDLNLVTENKPKIDIWKKRTVGEVFQQALKRYYERKAARGL